MQEARKNKIELLTLLQKAGVDTTKHRYLKPELLTICANINIETEVAIFNTIPSWVDRPDSMI